MSSTRADAAFPPIRHLLDLHLSAGSPQFKVGRDFYIIFLEGQWSL